MKKGIIILCSLLHLIVYGQSEAQQIIQKAINFEVLQHHLDSQEIVDFSKVKFIQDNGVIDNQLSLKYKSAPLIFNDLANVDLFTEVWTFVFLKAKVKSKKAHIIYKFIPHWKDIEGNHRMVMAGCLNLVVHLNFKKINDEWVIMNYTIEDIDFNNMSIKEKEYFIQVSSKYKPIVIK